MNWEEVEGKLFRAETDRFWLQVSPVDGLFYFQVNQKGYEPSAKGYGSTPEEARQLAERQFELISSHVDG